MRMLIKVLILGIVSVQSLAQARNLDGFSPEQLRMLALQVNETSDFEESPCSSASGKASKQVYFFDGDRGFCPRYFILQRPSTRAEDFGLTAADRLASTVQTSENEVYFKEIKKALSEETLIRNCLLIKTALTHLKTQIASSASDLHYYSKRGEKEAAQCAQKNAKRISADVGADGHVSKLNVLAYSMGSEAAMRFARLLIPAQLKVDRVQTMDPVGRVVNWTTGVITTEDNSLFEVPANVGVWINFFQKQDHYSLINTAWAHLGIRGSRVIGAQVNHEILPQDFENEQARRKGHVHILSQPMVLKAMEDAFL